MSRLVAQTRLETATRHNISAAADHDMKDGNEILMYREKPMKRWMGLYIVPDKKEKALILSSVDRLKALIT